MKKSLFYGNTTLDASFYQLFYGVTGDTQSVRDHYSTVGTAKQLFPNLECYVKVLSTVLHFDPDVYITNGTVDFRSDTLICHNHKAGAADVGYFMNHFYGNVIESVPQAGGQLHGCSVMRMLNSGDLMEYTAKWDAVLQSLQAHFKFDPDFYLFFYKDIRDAKNPFWDWISNGMFVGRHPNLASFTQKTNCLNEMSSVLHAKHAVDINFIVKTYVETMKQCPPFVAATAALSAVELPLYLFFNVCRTKRLFWSEAMQTEYVARHDAKYIETVAYLKAMNCYSMESLEKMIAAHEKAHAQQLARQPKPVVAKVVRALNKIDSYWSLLKKIVNPAFIETFKSINHLDGLAPEEMLQALLKTFVQNVFDMPDPAPANATANATAATAVGGDLNVMQLKSFALSFFYNALLGSRGSLGKAEYLAKVKDNARAFLKQLFDARHQIFDELVLDADLEYLIKHKKFIKMTRIVMKLLMLLL